MLDQLKIYFIEENNQNIQNYKSYSDLSGLTIEQLWTHANEYGYKEQRQIFNDCHYNTLFYDYYLADYRKIVLSNHPNFDWRIYNIRSEYDALTDYISKCDLSYNETTDISYTNPHYSLIAECPNYDYLTFPFAYGSAQWSSGLFGIIIPCKSIMKRGYFMYLYDIESDYQSSDLLDEYDFNEEKVRIRLDLYINGSQSDYYIEETLDPSKNMLGALFKKKNINGPTISVDYDEIVLEENSVISWFCSDLLGKTADGEYTNYPYNPSRNRFIMILEPYNTRFVSNSELSSKQNTLIEGNNISIVNNVISVTGIQPTITSSSNISLNTLNVNETFTNKLDISIESSESALSVSQYGSGNIANFTDALLLDSSGNTTIYKDLEIFGDTSMNILNVNDIVSPKFRATKPVNNLTNPFPIGSTDTLITIANDVICNGGTLIFNVEVGGYITTNIGLYEFQIRYTTNDDEVIVTIPCKFFFNQIGIHQAWSRTHVQSGVVASSMKLQLWRSNTNLICDIYDFVNVTITEMPY